MIHEDRAAPERGGISLSRRQTGRVEVHKKTEVILGHLDFSFPSLSTNCG
jgi:hypothetical protein